MAADAIKAVRARTECMLRCEVLDGGRMLR